MPETAEEKKDKTEAAKGPVDIKNMDTKQKAAIVVVSLGADRASQIYKYLNEQDVHLVHKRNARDRRLAHRGDHHRIGHAHRHKHKLLQHQRQDQPPKRLPRKHQRARECFLCHSFPFLCAAGSAAVPGETAGCPLHLKQPQAFFGHAFLPSGRGR